MDNPWKRMIRSKVIGMVDNYLEFYKKWALFFEIYMFKLGKNM